MNTKTQWILNWFESKSKPVQGDEAEQIAVNYFDAGLIDSMGVMDLIVDIESEFNIRFNEKHFQDRRFPTIEGLAAIIGEIERGES